MAKASAPQMTPEQQNQIARAIILGGNRPAVEMCQVVASGSLAGDPRGQILTLTPRNVGLQKKFILEIEFTLAQSAAETLNRTPFGPSNILSSVVYTDYSNNQRVSTTGWHLHQLATVRRQAPYAAAYTTDSPVANGSIFPVEVAPAAITTAQTVRHFVEIPLAYGDMDLRGAVWGNVVNATSNLQVTINPNIVVNSTGSQVLAAYKSSATQTGTISNFKYKLYQVYLDQIPVNPQTGQPILPALDLSTTYMLQNTVLTGISQGQDFVIPFANFREFLSTFFIFDQQGTLNTGSDINTISLTSANYTNIFQKDPYLAALDVRNRIGDDMPAGTYYFDMRSRPINTQTYGNMQLIVNPSVVAGAASQFLIGFESFAFVNYIAGAGSLPNT